MYTTIVKKMIARNGEREIVDSSPEEKHQFIVERQRPDFDDESILCIKFLDSDTESMEFAEESSWFVNPIYAERLTVINQDTNFDDYDTCNYESEFLDTKDVDDVTAMEFASIFGYSPCEAYGPKMASEFLPEVLLLQAQFPDTSMLGEYQEFYADLLKYGISNATFTVKLMLFCKYIKCESYQEKMAVVPQFLKTK